MHRKILVVLAVVVLLLLGFTQVGAVNSGEPDGNGHPYVGLAVFKDAAGSPLWRCSGTLLSSRIFLTAGHCTEAPAASAVIWFEPEIIRGDPAFGYPFGGPTSVTGTPYIHPQYNPNAFYLHDLGVVVLDKQYRTSQYGQLPALGTLDKLATRRGQQDITATVVGYGLQNIVDNPIKGPIFIQQDLRRERATVNVIDLNGTAGIPDGTSVVLSDNSHTGGTCFGDSGGPVFLNNSRVIVAVTSFGLNSNCTGVGGGYRVDTADDLDWLYSAFGKLL
jgi:V8-like Glu-specific endopeptidase